MKRILVATDGSTGGKAAVKEGLGLATETGAAVTFVYVRHLPLPIWGDPFYGRELQRDLEYARKMLDAAAEEAEENGIEAGVEILEGDPATQIADLASSREVDLIVVGSRGLGAVTGTLLGSVSRALVRRAKRPVLVVKAEPVREPQPVA